MADNWTVVNQRPTQQLVNGVFQQVIEVTFTTAKGYTGSVYIPRSTYGPESAKAAIDAEVAKVDAVANL
jgi:hypothetical protein